MDFTVCTWIDSNVRALIVLALALVWTPACDTARETPASAPVAAKPVSANRPSSEPTSPKPPKDEAEDLLNRLLPFAKQMLEKHGEFYPFGAAMLRDGSITAVAYKENDEHPPSKQVIDNLLTVYRTAAKTNTYRAVGIAYVITTLPPGATEKTDAIAIRLDHVTGYSVVVVFPYQVLRPGEVILGKPFTTRGAGDVFPSK